MPYLLSPLPSYEGSLPIYDEIPEKNLPLFSERLKGQVVHRADTGQSSLSPYLEESSLRLTVISVMA
jgi:hypothetical protein